MRLEPDIVLDASAYLRSTQGNRLAIEYVRASYYRHVRLYAPGHFYVEVANVLRKSVLAGRETQDDARLTLNAALRLSLVVETDPHIATDALEFSLEQGTSVYDAAYAVLALRRRAALVSTDSGLAQAAEAAGVTTTLIREGA